MEATGGEMAYEYDRLEREEGGGSFLMGLLAGTVLGAGLGMLFAPKAGSDLRRDLSEQTGRLRSTANDAYAQASEKVSQMVDRGRDAYERARGGAGSTTAGTQKPSGTDYRTDADYTGSTSGTGTSGVGTPGGYTSSGTGRV
jgi:gas vesicle protein